MYVVTGGAGFIGSNIVHGLEARGLGPVAVVDHVDSDEKARNIAKRREVETVAPEDLTRFLGANAGRIRGIIHMGAISATTETRLVRIIKNNIILSRRLWHWCADQGIPYIYASSAATYGDGSQGFDDDGAIEALGRMLADLSDAQSQVDACLDAMDTDPATLEQVEERLFALRALARKHGVLADDLGAHAATLRDRLAAPNGTPRNASRAPARR